MLLPCSKSLSGVQLISEERSYLILQALFLLTSEDFQIPSQQHNLLHCRLCQLSEKHVTKLSTPHIEKYFQNKSLLTILGSVALPECKHEKYLLIFKTSSLCILMQNSIISVSELLFHYVSIPT